MSLAGFHEVRFPMSLGFGAVGGPERRTEIVRLASGHEHRNAVWDGSRRRWEIGSAVQSLDQVHALIAFFEARRGPLYGFRFRDFMDDRSCAPEQAVSPVDQDLGVGDGVERIFQLSKTYGDVRRLILKPVEGTVRVAVDGVEMADGFEVDHATGEVSFATAPGGSALLTAGFRFDCPARFESDRIEASLEGFGAGRMVSVTLVELKG